MRNSKKYSHAFSLIELLIVIAIVGILSSIAYPSYVDSVERSRRSDAQSGLLGFANAMQRFHTENNTFVGAADGGATTGTPAIYTATLPTEGNNVFYNLTIEAATASTYTLRATPVNSQAGDGYLEVLHTGARRWDRNDDGDTDDANELNWDNI